MIWVKKSVKRLLYLYRINYNISIPNKPENPPPGSGFTLARTMSKDRQWLSSRGAMTLHRKLIYD